jgi:glycosyltransferase involved in cell wall biosynthesis
VISLILPYWQRQAAADRAMGSLIRHYPALDLEVIVVDDGSPEPYRAPMTPFPVRVVRLPSKTQAKNPCVPINAGVAVARGELIAISNPEIIHASPVLHGLKDTLSELGPSGYVLAACWCSDQQRWHCHSSRRHRDDNDVGRFLPEGAGYHFLGLMHRSLWLEAGGFDEDYRDGAGYDDPDFVMRLAQAGAEFAIRDDLVVEHQREGAHAIWPSGAHDRNRRIFLNKWGKQWLQATPTSQSARAH